MQADWKSNVQYLKFKSIRKLKGKVFWEKKDLVKTNGFG